jgi:hypothetical protein
MLSIQKSMLTLKKFLVTRKTVVDEFYMVEAKNTEEAIQLAHKCKLETDMTGKDIRYLGSGYAGDLPRNCWSSREMEKGEGKHVNQNLEDSC